VLAEVGTMIVKSFLSSQTATVIGSLGLCLREIWIEDIDELIFASAILRSKRARVSRAKRAASILKLT